ncbi:MAG: hypothetical protein M3O50_03100 [Myxococcota bacterium]|nr:hypothetical protein [Myxococcota bacterium]
MATTTSDTAQTRDIGDIASGAARSFHFGSEEAALLVTIREYVRKRPLVTLAAAGAAATVAGLLMPRVARLAFVAAAGYIGSELWRREGRMDMRELAKKLAVGSQ